MYIYQLTYLWYEDYRPHLLVSDLLYSQEQWAKLCRDAINTAAETFTADSWIGWDTLAEKAVGVLIAQNPDLKEAKITDFGVWGTCIIDDKKDGECETMALSPDGLNRVMEHNAAIQSRLRREAEVEAVTP